MTGSLPSPTLDHVGLTCRSMSDALDFYHGLLGLPVIDQGEGHGQAAGIAGARIAYAMLDLGRGQVIELLEYREPVTEAQGLPVNHPGAAHVALAVPDLDQLLARLSAVGIEPLAGKVVTAPISGGGRWDGARLVYVLDPDRHVVELIQFARGLPADTAS